jgi:hypothetical protein
MTTERHDEPGSDLPVELAQLPRRALAAAGDLRLEQLSQVSEAQARQLHGMGQNALGQLRVAPGETG